MKLISTFNIHFKANTNTNTHTQPGLECDLYVTHMPSLIPLYTVL